MTTRFMHLRLAVNLFSIVLIETLLIGCRSVEPLDSRQAVSIIFDTDMGTDVDDAGALAILHIMADQGEAKILATMSANRNRWCAPTRQ